MKQWLITAVFGAGLALSSGVSNALTPQQQGEMYNQCSHPNYQGSSSRCGGGSSGGGGRGHPAYFHVGLANAPDGRRILLGKMIRANLPSEAKEKVGQMVVAKCNSLVGGGCTINSVDQNACVAVASNPYGKKQYAFSAGYNQCAEVQREAMKYCQKENPTTANQCKLTETVRSPEWYQAKP